jgi:hypothetical protein
MSAHNKVATGTIQPPLYNNVEIYPSQYKEAIFSALSVKQERKKPLILLVDNRRHRKWQYAGRPRGKWALSFYLSVPTSSNTSAQMEFSNFNVSSHSSCQGSYDFLPPMPVRHSEYFGSRVGKVHLVDIEEGTCFAHDAR